MLSPREDVNKFTVVPTPNLNFRHESNEELPQNNPTGLDQLITHQIKILKNIYYYSLKCKYNQKSSFKIKFI
jgi:hypothetical protein